MGPDCCFYTYRNKYSPKNEEDKLEMSSKPYHEAVRYYILKFQNESDKQQSKMFYMAI